MCLYRTATTNHCFVFDVRDIYLQFFGIIHYPILQEIHLNSSSGVFVLQLYELQLYPKLSKLQLCLVFLSETSHLHLKWNKFRNKLTARENIHKVWLGFLNFVNNLDKLKILLYPVHSLHSFESSWMSAKSNTKRESSLISQKFEPTSPNSCCLEQTQLVKTWSTRKTVLTFECVCI